jgi:DNA-binding transcriptional ArsR family regulator
MKDTPAFEVFEKAFEKGLKGKVESFDIWLKSLEIDPLKFDAAEVSNFLMQNLELTIDLEKEVETIGQFIGFYSKERKGLYHIPIVGVFGSGKSHLIHLTQMFLQKKKIPLTYFFMDASSFREVSGEGEEQQVYYQLLDKVKAEHFDILLIDSCEKDKDIVNSLKQIANILKNGVVVTSWTPEHWNYFRDEIEDYLPVSKEIYLGPLHETSTSQFVSVILHYASNGRFQLSEEAIKRIYSFSNGVPRTIIQLLTKAFNEAFLSHRKNVDEKAVESAAKNLGIEDFFDRINKLSELQIVILKQILLRHDERGIRPSSLVEILEKDKATISYHLNILSRNKFVTQEKIGRSSFYRIKEEIKPFVQLKIIQEGEYLA